MAPRDFARNRINRCRGTIVSRRVTCSTRARSPHCRRGERKRHSQWDPIDTPSIPVEHADSRSRARASFTCLYSLHLKGPPRENRNGLTSMPVNHLFIYRTAMLLVLGFRGRCINGDISAINVFTCGMVNQFRRRLGSRIQIGRLKIGKCDWSSYIFPANVTSEIIYLLY